jgi:hypothetical protein
VFSRLYICRSRSIVTWLRPNQSIKCSFIFLRVRVNVALLLPRIPLAPLTISDKPSRCVAEWVDANLAPFLC